MNTTIPFSTAKAVSEDSLSLGQTVFLHLFPGVLITLFYLLAAPWVMAQGYPPMMAMMLAILFIAVPVELGELYRRGKARNGRFSLKGIVTLRSRIPAWQVIILPLGLLVLAAALSLAASPVDRAWASVLSRRLPGWYFLLDLSAYASYSKTALQQTLLFNLLLNMLAAPLAEELYFRGFLLPRMTRFGAWAPALSALLFAAYHLWQVYYLFSVTIIFIPVTYLVWRKKNVGLSILFHCMLNLVSNFLLFGALLSR